MRKMAKAKHVHYVNNKEMLQELKDYNAQGEDKAISERLGEMFLKIATRYASRPTFYGYSYKEDMIGDAVERMCMQVAKFNPEHPKANPFAYFTMVAHRQFLQTLKREKRQTELRKSYRKKIWDDLCDEEGLDQFKEQEDG
jgi:DNA-directed RNA polymerase specialized sigma24 family protein